MRRRMSPLDMHGYECNVPYYWAVSLRELHKRLVVVQTLKRVPVEQWYRERSGRKLIHAFLQPDQENQEYRKKRNTQSRNQSSP